MLQCITKYVYCLLILNFVSRRASGSCDKRHVWGWDGYHQQYSGVGDIISNTGPGHTKQGDRRI